MAWKARQAFLWYAAGDLIKEEDEQCCDDWAKKGLVEKSGSKPSKSEEPLKGGVDGDGDVDLDDAVEVVKESFKSKRKGKKAKKK